MIYGAPWNGSVAAVLSTIDRVPPHGSLAAGLSTGAGRGGGARWCRRSSGARTTWPRCATLVRLRRPSEHLVHPRNPSRWHKIWRVTESFTSRWLSKDCWEAQRCTQLLYYVTGKTTMQLGLTSRMHFVRAHVAQDERATHARVPCHDVPRFAPTAQNSIRSSACASWTSTKSEARAQAPSRMRIRAQAPSCACACASTPFSWARVTCLGNETTHTMSYYSPFCGAKTRTSISRAI